MNKTEFIRMLAIALNTRIDEASIIYDQFIECLIEALMTENEVVLKKLGKLYVVNTKNKNPIMQCQDGKDYNYRNVKLKTSKQFKDILDEKVPYESKNFKK